MAALEVPRKGRGRRAEAFKTALISHRPSFAPGVGNFRFSFRMGEW